MKILLTSLLFCCLPGAGLHAANLSLITSSEDVHVGDIVSVETIANSEEQAINVIEAEIEFSDEVELVDVSTAGSVVTLWVNEPQKTANNSVYFAGGIPHGAYITGGVICRLTFRATQTGKAQFSFIPESTHLLSNTSSNTSTSPPPPQFFDANVPIVEPDPDRTIISSPTHPDQHLWYTATDARIEWNIQDNIRYSYRISTDPFGLPDDIEEAVTGSVEFRNLSDGVHYVVLSQKQPNHEWQFVGRYRIQIDTTPPRSFSPVVTDAIFPGVLTAVFTAQDDMSGVDHYVIVEGNETTDPASSPYRLRFQDQSEQIRIIAIDQAGNQKTAVIEPRIGRPIFFIALFMLSLVLWLLWLLLLLVFKKKRVDIESGHKV